MLLVSVLCPPNYKHAPVGLTSAGSRYSAKGRKKVFPFFYVPTTQDCAASSVSALVKMVRASLLAVQFQQSAARSCGRYYLLSTLQRLQDGHVQSAFQELAAWLCQYRNE